MVVRNNWRAAAVTAPRLAAARAATLLFLVGIGAIGSATLQAQTPGSQEPGQNPGSTTPGSTVEASAAKSADAQLGRVVAEKVQLRCWPSQVATPPMFEDELVKDEVVNVGAVEGGFRQVILPLGPVGYVSKKFTVTGADGAVVTKGNGVSFRYRPRSTEAPVDYLADATPLAIVGEDGDWWRARAAGVKAWLPEAEVQLVTTPSAADRDALAKSTARYQAEVQARLDAIAQQAKVAAQNDADLAAVKVVEDAFATEITKPATEQKFEPLTVALDKLTATLSEESAARPAIASLQKRIETQRWIAEALIIQQDKPVPATDVQPVVQPKDELDRFQSIGWLRYESTFGAPGTYYLEKGGKRLHVVTCASGRYDLALFLDREVGLIGPRRRPNTEGVSNLDVERIEVLGVPKH
ncbi:MAG: hypothetical protein H6838_16595 [Planctomycetes bacterium]|nr:hypothetical protein [Planctomycetota bacterium]